MMRLGPLAGHQVSALRTRLTLYYAVTLRKLQLKQANILESCQLYPTNLLRARIRIESSARTHRDREFDPTLNGRILFGCLTSRCSNHNSNQDCFMLRSAVALW